MTSGPDAALRLHEPLPQLEAPVLVSMLTGWIDASGAAAAAMQAVEAAGAMRPLVTFDGDVFVDYRARRPTMELRDGINTRLVWPEIELKVGRDPAGRDLLVLTGPEPDTAWRRFGDLVAGLARDLHVRTAVFLGAYPFAAPHTRPPRLSCTSPSADLVASLPFVRSSVDVPAGMAAALEHALTGAGVPALGIWVQVPHYLGAMVHPAASIALLDALDVVTGVRIDAGALRREADEQRERVDQLVATNPEHRSMIAQLESAYDELAEADGSGPHGEMPADIPSGDEIADEIERFLRGRGDRSD